MDSILHTKKLANTTTNLVSQSLKFCKFVPKWSKDRSGFSTKRDLDMLQVKPEVNSPALPPPPPPSPPPPSSFQTLKILSLKQDRKNHQVSYCSGFSTELGFEQVKTENFRSKLWSKLSVKTEVTTEVKTQGPKPYTISINPKPSRQK